MTALEQSFAKDIIESKHFDTERYIKFVWAR